MVSCPAGKARSGKARAGKAREVTLPSMERIRASATVWGAAVFRFASGSLPFSRWAESSTVNWGFGACDPNKTLMRLRKTGGGADVRGVAGGVRKTDSAPKGSEVAAIVFTRERIAGYFPKRVTQESNRLASGDAARECRSDGNGTFMSPGNRRLSTYRIGFVALYKTVLRLHSSNPRIHHGLPSHLGGRRNEVPTGFAGYARE